MLCAKWHAASWNAWNASILIGARFTTRRERPAPVAIHGLYWDNDDRFKRSQAVEDCNWSGAEGGENGIA